ncbi:hypothetical protein ACFQU2_27275 [Siccirubricoccus deserti]
MFAHLVGVPMPPRPALSGRLSFTSWNFSQTLPRPGRCSPNRA